LAYELLFDWACVNKVTMSEEENKDLNPDLNEQSRNPVIRIVKGVYDAVRHNKRKAALAGATVAAAGTAAAGAYALQNNKNPGPVIGPNVAAQPRTAEAKPPMPKVTATPQQTLDKIEFVVDGQLSPNKLPSDPLEIGRQLIEAAQETDDPHRNEYGVPLLEGNRGAAVVIQSKRDFTLYQWPKGSKNFTPANPSNDGSAGAITVEAGQAVIIDNFVELVTYTDPSLAKGARDEPAYILATLPNSDKFFFISPDLLKQEQGEDITIKTLSRGGAPITGGDASIGNNHNFIMGDLSNASELQIADSNALNAFEKQNGYIPVKQRQDHPPPPTAPLP
jgi:hypothetical protein